MTPDHMEQIEAAVEAKLRDLDAIPFGIETGRRLDMGGMKSDGASMTPEQHRENRRLVMKDIAERVGLHFFEMTDAVLLDQFVTMSVIQNHDTAGLLRSLINSFLIAYTKPKTTLTAFQHLRGAGKSSSMARRKHGAHEPDFYQATLTPSETHKEPQ